MIDRPKPPSKFLEAETVVEQLMGVPVRNALQKELSPREYIYAVIVIDSLSRRADSAEGERDAIRKLFNAVKELIK